jgi:hypothetical protein
VPLGPPMASCSPVDGKGRLAPTTWVSLLTAETVEAPARMPMCNQASTQSHGGREGINGTGVSRHPEANCRIASFAYYSYPRNRKQIHQNHQPRKRDNFYCFFKRANNAMAMLPPLP